MGSCAWSWSAWGVGCATGVAAVALAALGWFGVQVLIIRLDARLHGRVTWGAPSLVVVLALLQRRAIELAQAMLPAPLRVADLCSEYGKSQTLFTLVNLDIADHLARAGPRTAAQLAALSGAANAAWLERLLAFACHLGLLRRTRRPVAPVLDMRADSRLQIRAGSPDSQRRGDQDPATATATSPAKPQAGKAAAGQPAYEYVYHLTTVSEVLCTDHPCSVAAFVRLQQDHAKPMMACLTQGIQQGTTPFELWSCGWQWFDWLGAHPAHGANFDQAMQQIKYLGAGTPIVDGYSGWRKAASVIDVAGGIGGFVSEVMSAHPGLQGVVLDRKDQVERGQQWWAKQHADMMHRITFVAGDMFVASSLPEPAANGLTLYTLRMILHDWSDEDCIRILTAIRQRISPGQAQQVKLVMIEMALLTAEEAPLRTAHLCGRHTSDLMMMTMFGDGKERNREQFAALLAASGWRLNTVIPTKGLYFIIEALPA